MKTFSFEKREIRSFRLKTCTLGLLNFLKKRNQFGFFVACDALNPQERIALRQDIASNKVKLTRISDKVGNLLFSSKEYF